MAQMALKVLRDQLILKALMVPKAQMAAKVLRAQMFLKVPMTQMVHNLEDYSLWSPQHRHSFAARKYGHFVLALRAHNLEDYSL